MQTLSQVGFEIEKVIKRKGDKRYVNWKGHDNSFNSWIDKNCIKLFKMIIVLYVLYKIIKYFPIPYKPFGGNLKVELDLSNHAAKADLYGLIQSMIDINVGWY